MVASKLIAFTSFLAIASAMPAPSGGELVPRALDTTSHCGQWDNITSGVYSLLNDQWGINGVSGSQCSNWVSLSGTTAAWKTTWTWGAGSGGVKTFANLQLNAGLNKQLKNIKSIQVYTFHRKVTERCH
jgi:xyloglucan-specific endo-beta-1,4-glucanase